jgi:nitrite reductase/ring-hydroxylating ferredoxin subunit
MDAVEVGVLDDFVDGAVALREVGGRKIGIVRWGDEIFAVNNDCPHQGGPLCEGHVGPRLRSDAEGVIEVDAGAPILACAWHGWEFDLRDGTSAWDDQYRVRTYPVTIDEQGRVYVQPRTGRRSPAAAMQTVQD